jgi:hypothetical protein
MSNEVLPEVVLQSSSENPRSQTRIKSRAKKGLLKRN